MKNGSFLDHEKSLLHSVELQNKTTGIFYVVLSKSLFTVVSRTVLFKLENKYNIKCKIFSILLKKAEDPYILESIILYLTILKKEP